MVLTVVVLVAVAEAMGVQVEDIQMGTITTPADIPVDNLEVETILQPIPTGMTILGLEVAV